MEIDVILTRKDYISFNKYYYKKSLKKKILIIIIVSFTLPFLMSIGNSLSLSKYVSDCILTLVIFSIIYLGIGSLLINRTGSLPSENGSILGKKKFIITDEGLIEESEHNRNIQKWSGIKSIEQNKDLIFIFVDKIAAYIIPKRFFETNEDEQKFWAQLNEKNNAT